MTEETKYQQNLNLYKKFVLGFNFKEKDLKKGLESALQEINLIKLSKFKPKLELKSTILENLFPESKTRLKLNFQNFEIKIEKKSVSISYPKDMTPILQEFKFYPRFFSQLTDSEKEKKKISVEEIKEIDEIVKLYLMQKLFETKKAIELKSIDIFAILDVPNEFSFDSLDKTLETHIESNKRYKMQNVEFEIKDGDDLFTLYMEKKVNIIIFYSILKSEINWTKPVLDILNDNIKKFQEILEELKL